MSKIVRFRGPREREAEAIQSAAQQIVDEFGPSAGLVTGRLARSGALDEIARARLLRIAEEIERRQGFGWYFADEATP